MRRLKLSIIFILVVFSSLYMGCDDSNGNKITTVTTTEELAEYLASYPINTSDNPIAVKVNVNLDTEWESLLTVLEIANKYVALDLSGSTGMTAFNPGNFNTGEKMIVGLVLPNSSTGIVDIGSDSTFWNFAQLRVVSGNNVVSISDYAFNHHNSLTSVSFPAVTSIGEGAFLWCNSLTSVSFPVVTSIGEYAFYWCNSLTGVSFPAVTSIGNVAFGDCHSLRSVSFPAATSIGNGAFGSCGDLRSVSFPAVTSVGEYAFSNCDSLRSASFPVATSIGGNAFWDNTNLTSASFPAATSIGDSVFGACDNLTSFVLAGTGSLSVLENRRALVRNGTDLVAFPSASGSIVMNSITSISGGAFFANTNLTSVSFPAVTSIADWAFGGCTGLTSVSFPAVTSIGAYAFSGCWDLTSITLGTITEEDFAIGNFYGNLREVYFTTGGGAGTYVTTNPGFHAVWIKE